MFEVNVARDRRWRDKFRDAGRGLWTGVFGERNFRVHGAAIVIVVMLAFWLQCNMIEWALIALSIGLVVTAELLNTALERLFHGLDDAAKLRIRGCLDIAAGGVLFAAMTATTVGAIVLGPKLSDRAGVGIDRTTDAKR